MDMSVRHFPIGAMGTFEVSGADGTHPILIDQGSTHHPRRESMWVCQQGIPLGRWKIFKAIIRAMGDLQAIRLARTHAAVLPLMVDDEMVTVLLWTKTPPPCKHKCKTCENPIGENFMSSGTYMSILNLTKASAADVQARVEASTSGRRV